MENQFLTSYIHQFQNLNRAHNLGGAPHKPILLLSIAQLINQGEIFDNRIRITEELVLAFKDNWYRFVDTPHTLNFALPFFHMGYEPFWKLVPHPGAEIELTKSKSIKSFRSLQETFNYAWLDQPLFELLKNPEMNQLLVNVLLDRYFPRTKNRQQAVIPIFLENPDSLMVAEPLLQWEKPIAKVTKDQKEQTVFLRSALFKREIPRIYSYKCAISGLQVKIAENKYRLVEACHIKPFSLSETETIGNGIALTPTLHKAFDIGLVTIDKDYRTVVSSKFMENLDSAYKLNQFHGKAIYLPADKRFYPSQESLEWHRSERFERRN
ncbi:MAG TPA: HNH endonuclease [Fluviicola sp.]|nr:HNH endonuclease [Fluviicola sp.]